MLRLSAFADEVSSDPQEQIDCLAAQGIRHIEFRSIHGTNVLALGREEHEAFRSLLQRHGFGLSAIGSPIGKISITEPFPPHLDRYAIALDLADFYACPRIRVFSFYMPPEADPAAHRDEVLARMGRLAELAAERGVTLLLENEKGIYGDTAARVADAIETVDSPALRHAFDPANYVEIGQTITEAWHRLNRHVAHFHVKDFDPRTGLHVPTGQGAGQIPQILTEAVAAGFDGFCTLEPHLIVAEKSYGFTGPERFAEAATALKRALDHRALAYA